MKNNENQLPLNFAEPSAHKVNSSLGYTLAALHMGPKSPTRRSPTFLRTLKHNKSLD